MWLQRYRLLFIIQREYETLQDQKAAIDHFDILSPPPL